ncbi:glycosyltransferase family 2 protein [Winogradskyella undariae]|uniref:glycosyltransferase family 2 protein n=1 Tax=Winogradskyella undariae TaxID=1285465 RepID=UPI00156AAC9B|nr:glycosyltransferase family 2 protein [Winogradskyella undariae]NRR91028.1 glycosyltransferase family 2 protein [Winogradskyella undariae]
MNPKVTIATITYNSSKYVRKSIESVLAQSFTDFEYLISDDCSTDNTWDIVKEYKDPRIRAWRNETNLREYPNRNKTLFEAKGEYIIWIDGDDIFYPHGLEFMVKMLDAFPNSAMACARPHWDNMVYPYELTPKEAFRYEFLGSPILVNGFPDTLIRTKALKALNGFPTDVISGDTYSKRMLAFKNNVLLINQQVSWWRRTPDQASSKLYSIQGVLNTFESSIVIIDNEDCPLDASEKAMAKELMRIGMANYLIKNQLFLGKIMTVFKIKKRLKLKLFHFYKAVNKRDFFYTTGSGVDPLLLDFCKNPYASNYER